MEQVGWCQATQPEQVDRHLVGARIGLVGLDQVLWENTAHCTRDQRFPHPNWAGAALSSRPDQ